MTVTSTGTGNLSLGVAVAGYQTFSSSGAQNGDTVSYTIEDGVNWEVGTGTFNSVAGTLSRTVTQSYNGTSYGTTAISVTTNAQVYITALAADIVVNGGALGTPSSGTLTNATGLPISTGVSGLGTGIATFLATPTSDNLAAAVTDEIGTGALVFASSPTIATPTLSTSFTSPLHIGGTTASSTLTLQSTSGVGTSDSIVFKVGNNGATTAGVFDTNGNLGIGTTSPSAYNGLLSVKASDRSAIGYFGGTTYAVRFGANSSFATVEGVDAATGVSSYQPISINGSVVSLQSGGTERASIDANGTFRVRGAGTAGSTDAVQFSGSAPASAMTLDASGNLGVGTPSPNTYGKLAVNGDIYLTYGNLIKSASSGTAAYDTIIKNYWDGAYDTLVLKSAGGSGSGQIVFQGTTGTPKATLDASGNLGVGTSSPGRRLEITQSLTAGEIGQFIKNSASSTTNNAASLWFGTWSDASSTNVYNAKISALNTNGSTAATALTFTTYDGSGSTAGIVERVRIDSSGNLLVGSTNASPTSGTKCLTIENGTAATASPSSTITIYSSNLSAGNTMLSLYTEGTVVNANTTAATTHRIAIRVNGTVYYLLANTSA